MSKCNSSRVYSNTRRRRRLRKEIRETMTAIVIGITGAAFLIGLWIGSVLQTMEVIG